MFSLIVAWIAFVLTSFTVFAITVSIIYEMFFQTDLEKLLEEVDIHTMRRTKKTWWSWKVGVILAVWIGSGVYLFG